MSRAWPKVRLGEVADRVERSVTPVPGREYRQIGVRLWGEGAYERETMDGAQTTYTKLFRTEAGDIIVNKIWARNGSVAVVPPSLAGCHGSGEFPMFTPKPDRLDSQWMHWLTKTRNFWAQCDEKSQGTSGKNRIRPEQFLGVEIPLPPLSEQRRIVARIEQLAAKIEEARGLRRQAVEETSAIMGAYLNRLFGNPYANEQGTLKLNTYLPINTIANDVSDGPHVTPTYVEHGVPFITVLNITSGRVDFAGAKFISDADHLQFQKRARIEKGDVLISKDGTIGIPCFVDVDREFSYFVSVALIKPKRELLNGRFLTWVLRAPYLQHRIKERSRGDMIRHLVLREIRELIVPELPLREQHHIVAQLDNVQAFVDGLNRLQIDTTAELDALLPSVLDKAFKGEL